MSNDAPSTYWGNPGRYDSTPTWGRAADVDPAAPVTSVFGRTGDVIYQSGDIVFPVTTVFGRTGSVTLTKADVTGTGLAASDVGADASGAAATAQAASLQKTSNLSDLASVSIARTNLGLGTAATQATSAFDAAGAASTAQAAAIAASDPAGSATTARAQAICMSLVLG